MRIFEARALAISAASLIALGFAAPAHAAGCNGVVNVFVWGCAPWDNNNGPRYPYFKKKVITIPANGTQIVTKDGAKMALRNGTYYPLIGQDGAGVIGQDGAGLRVWSPQ